MTRRALSEAQVDDVVTRYLAGESSGRLAADYSVNQHTIEHWITRRGYNCRKHSRVSEDEQRRMAVAYESGLTIEQVAAQFLENVSVVTQSLTRLGIKRRPRGPREGRNFSESEIATMRTMYENGATLEAIGRELFTSPTAVSTHLKRQGVVVRKHTHMVSTIKSTGRRSHKSGETQHYRLIPLEEDHRFFSMAHRKSGARLGYIPEHRFVLATKLDRPLTRNESVHHINGDTLDNSSENLQLRHGPHGKGVVLCCFDCGSHNIGYESIADTAT